MARSIRPSPLPIALALGGLLLSGCDPAAPTPAAPTASPRFDFGNGPAELPNLVRFSSDDGGFFLADPESGLAVAEGLPTDPSTLFACNLGGAERASTLRWQQVGLLHDVLHQHVVGRDVNIHVFRLSELDPSAPDPFLDLWCTGTPIAVGTGRLTLVDNDLEWTSGRTNVVSLGIRGTATDLRTGQRLRVTARYHAVWDVSGVPEVEPVARHETTDVRVEPIGRP